MVTTNDLEVRKAIGRAHLQADDLENAVGIFAGILREYPRDIDSYVALGDCYLAGDDGETAAELYLEAWRLNPLNKEIERRLSLAQMESSQGKNGNGTSAAQSDSPHSVHEDELNPTDPEAITDLLKKLTGSADDNEDVDEEDIRFAEQILRDIEDNQNPGQVVTEQLDKIIKLMPALIQLNIRQAQAENRPDLVEALENLLVEVEGTSDTDPGGDVMQVTVPPIAELPSVLFIGPDSDVSPYRQLMPAQALAELGCNTLVSTDFPKHNIKDNDVVIVNRAHVKPDLLEAMAMCKAAQIPIILDVDIDYERMPLEHPLYESIGFGKRPNAQSYSAALILADKVCVPSRTLAAIMYTDGYDAAVVPPGWMRGNELWNREKPERHTTNIAWLGHPGHLEDLAHIRRMIIRILREFPQTNLVIAGDPRAYQLFDRIPESRLLYLPPASHEDYPYYLSQADILLAPLQNTPFNRSQSDQILLDAGVSGIPWVASPIPSFLEWGAGGLIANSLIDWHTNLRQLIKEPELCKSLGGAGKMKANEREMQTLRQSWLNLVQQVLQKTS